ncbi:MAG: CBS domain-containing protein [Deltaproteobacteria bacterium]|nr:CBS domain-containing protein [Deltaproteobacteria bacterium]
MTKIPPLRIKDVMTRSAHSIAPNATLRAAKELMQYHTIRHLPVVQDDRVVGILSLGDLYAMESIMEMDPEETEVATAMSPDPFTVEAETPLGEVVRAMARRRIGSVLITRDGRLAGIFTATDACRLLGDLLHGNVFA